VTICGAKEKEQQRLRNNNNNNNKKNRIETTTTTTKKAAGQDGSSLASDKGSHRQSQTQENCSEDSGGVREVNGDGDRKASECGVD
jgi:hypothetical protein